MPHEWSDIDGARRLLIWRHRSLDARGFAWVIALTALALVLPLLAVLGLTVMWGLLPFAVAALAGLWWAMQYGWRGGGVTEELTLTPDRISVTRRDPGRADRHWQGNPYWTRLTLRRDGAVEDYLTLTDGSGREIELAAFVPPEERRELRAEVTAALAKMRAARTDPPSPEM